MSYTDLPHSEGTQKAVSKAESVLSETIPSDSVCFSAQWDNLSSHLPLRCRQARAEYESELKLRSMNNDHVGALEWDWVCSMLQGRGGASQSFLARARQQVCL